jgi:hypothetical protein
MNDLIGLRFLLKGGSFMNVIIPSKEVDDILDAVHTGKVLKFESPDPTIMSSWVVDGREIQGIHTCRVEQVNPPLNQPGQVNPHISGLMR